MVTETRSSAACQSRHSRYAVRRSRSRWPTTYARYSSGFLTLVSSASTRRTERSGAALPLTPAAFGQADGGPPVAPVGAHLAGQRGQHLPGEGLGAGQGPGVAGGHRDVDAQRLLGDREMAG